MVIIETQNTSLYAFQKFGDMVLRTAYACCRNYAEAEDITQDVFLLLHTKKMEFNDDEHMKAWLLRVAINKCKNLKKSFRFSRTQPIDESCEAFYNMDTSYLEVREIISSLPQKYSIVIYLYYFEGYTPKEISEMLEKNENTVKSLLQRGKEKLKAEFTKVEAFAVRDIERRT